MYICDKGGRRAYSVDGRIYIGKNLFNVIINLPDSQGPRDPPCVQDWLMEQAKAYLQPDWDPEFIEKIADETLHFDEEFWANKALHEEGYDLSRLFDVDIDREKIKAIAEKYKEQQKIYDALHKLANNLENREDFHNIAEQIHIRAGDDFDLFFNEEIGTWDEDNPEAIDEEVRRFFNKDFPFEGYYCEEEETLYDESEVYFCPDCDEPRPKSEQEGDFEKINTDMEQYDGDVFYCVNCELEMYFKDEAFVKNNRHLPQEELVALAM